YEMYVDERLVATEEIMALHVDQAADAAVAFPATIAAGIEGIGTHRPDWVGRAIGGERSPIAGGCVRIREAMSGQRRYPEVHDLPDRPVRHRAEPDRTGQSPKEPPCPPMSPKRSRSRPRSRCWASAPSSVCRRPPATACPPEGRSRSVAASAVPTSPRWSNRTDGAGTGSASLTTAGSGGVRRPAMRSRSV